MSDFLSFRTMITPVIIQIVCWIGVALCVILGLGLMIFGANYYGSRASVVGLLILVFGPVAVRLYCELLIISFRVNDTLMEIKEVLEERRSMPPSQLM